MIMIPAASACRKMYVIFLYRSANKSCSTRGTIQRQSLLLSRADTIKTLSQKQLLVSLYTKTYEHVAHLAIQQTQQAHDGELEAFDGNAKFRFHALVGADLLSVGDVLEGLLKEVN